MMETMHHDDGNDCRVSFRTAKRGFRESKTVSRRVRTESLRCDGIGSRFCLLDTASSCISTLFDQI